MESTKDDWKDELKRVLKLSEVLEADLSMEDIYPSSVLSANNPEKLPELIVKPSSVAGILELVEVSNKLKVGIIPVSNSLKFHNFENKSIQTDRCVILDLTSFNRIFRLDPENKVAWIEPGVSFKQLYNEAKKKGMRILMPLMVLEGRSVLSTYLEKYPQAIPRYHWDTIDPLICMEIVFGNGKKFRTGSAAGPGSIGEQFDAGQALVNQMGPTQFSISRVIQGAMGTMGVVTWASIKIEPLPELYDLEVLKLKSLDKIGKALSYLTMNRVGDEVFSLNGSALGPLSEGIKKKFPKVSLFFKDLSKADADAYYIFIVISAGGKFAPMRITYQKDYINVLKSNIPEIESISIEENTRESLIKLFTQPYPGEIPAHFSEKTWSFDIFLLSSLDKIESVIGIFNEELARIKKEIRESSSAEKEDILELIDCVGVYLQPIVQGTNVHIEFRIPFNPDNDGHVEILKKHISSLTRELIKKGLFFYRPYGEWASIFSMLYKDTLEVLRKVKDIFDPNGILNPGVIPYSKFLKEK